MAITIRSVGIAFITIGLSLGLVAQSEERAVPPPAASSFEDNGLPAEEVRPDVRPLTGSLPITLGSFGTERSFLAPSLRFSQMMDSNPNLTSGPSETVALTNLSANALLQRIWRRSQFSLNYTGGGSIYTGHSDLNSTFHAAQLQQSFQFRRWSLTLVDNISYTPEAAFGYPGLAGGSSNLAPGTAPNQTILTNRSSQLSNTALGQVNYNLNSRSSITVSGDFDLLRSPSGNLLPSDEGRIQLGYNRNLNSRDSLGISYGLHVIRHPNLPPTRKLDSHSVQLAYGRRITGRLALQASGGSQINRVDDPSLGSATQTTWTAQSSVIYRFRRAQLQSSYAHSAGGGAGILSEAKTDELSGTLATRLTRMFSASIGAGYARNSGLQLVSSSTGSVFDTEFVRATLERSFGHQAAGFFKYTFQHQSTNVPVCGLGFCGSDLSRHTAGIGLEWHMRPVLLQ